MEKLCRCCLVLLREDEYFYNLLMDFNLAKCYIECTNLTLDFLDDNDIYPKHICENCYKQIMKCYEFQKMCEINMLNYKNFLDEQMKIYMKEEEEDVDEKIKEEGREEEEAEKEIDTNNYFTVEESQSGAEVFDKVEEVYILNETNEEFGTEELLSADYLVNEHQPNSITELNDKEYNNNCEFIKNDYMKFYYCNICPKWFYKEERLEAHLRTHEGLKPYACSICSRQYKRASNLYDHIKEIHFRIKFHCNFNGCEHVYTAKRSLVKHIKESHPSVLTPKQNEQEKQPTDAGHICEVCGKTFKRKVFLTRHRYVHMDKSEYPYACEYCKKRFYIKQFLRDHLNRHAGINNFRCTICDKRKPTKTALKQHMQTHSNQRYKCDLCDGAFISKSNLKTHMKRIHNAAGIIINCTKK